MKYILGIDQGTTGTKAVLVDSGGTIRASGYKSHAQHYPAPGWVEHDVEEIWQCVMAAVSEAFTQASVRPSDICAIGIANQGETVVPFSRSTSRPFHPAVVWSDRRTSGMVDTWNRDADFGTRVAASTGLTLDAYFSASKMKWLLEEIPDVAAASQRGDLCLSTLDAWMIYRMTNGKRFVTDPSTASRTLLFNIHKQTYDAELLHWFGIPEDVLPSVYDTTGAFGVTDPSVFCGIQAPIVAGIVDQPAALFGQLCLEPGQAKCTYGTGCFLYMNIGDQPVPPRLGLLTTLVWRRQGQVTYALEGGVYSAGSAVDWLCQTGIANDVKHLGELASSVPDCSGVLFVPALTGLAAPYWDSDARGAFVGITPSTERAHLARAVLEGIAHRVADVVESMNEASGYRLATLRVDGGPTKSDVLMQLQADILGLPIEVAAEQEATALGAAYLAGLETGMFGLDELVMRRTCSRRYEPRPRADASWRTAEREKWRHVVQQIRGIGDTTKG